MAEPATEAISTAEHAPRDGEQQRVTLGTRRERHGLAHRQAALQLLYEELGYITTIYEEHRGQRIRQLPRAT